MGSKQANLDFVIEQMAEAGDVTARKMFGEYGIYCRGKLVALFCDDQLFIKPTETGQALLGKPKLGAPYPRAKPWFFISGDRCEDSEWLAELVRVTERELPAPKPKPVRKAKPKAKTKTRAKAKSRPQRHSSKAKS